MKNKSLFLVDIRLKQKEFLFLKKYFDDNSELISLTPYSTYILEELSLGYKTYTDVVSKDMFDSLFLQHFNTIKGLFKNNSLYQFLFRDLVGIASYEIFIENLYEYLKTKKEEKYNIIYISDALPSDEESIGNNNISTIYKCKYIDKSVTINSHDRRFYKKNNYVQKYNFIMKQNNILAKLFRKYFDNAAKELLLKYDNNNFKNEYVETSRYPISKKLKIDKIDNMICDIENNILSCFSKHYINVLMDFRSVVLNKNEINQVKLRPFVFLSTNKEYAEVLMYKSNNIPVVFMQHGSYISENVFLRYNEILPADINFVLNDYTKDLFEKRGAKKVHTVGSINFNYPIKEKTKRYDFLYITYCSSYGYTGIYAGNKPNLLSIDGSNVYEHHKSIIKLFGEKFTNKEICIKIQPGIFTGTNLYIPFLELSKKYKNVTIEFSMPLQKLIEKSQYLISDYFSSEFINRELHYKKDIILFKNFPIPLPEDILEDMQKMFILIDTIKDLENCIYDIATTSRDRKRYDDIIEHYSSKKCETKTVVGELLKKELHGR